MCKQIGIEEAAAIIGVSPQTVRVGLQKGVFPFGAAFKIPGSTRYTYVIYPAEFERLFGEVKE